MAEGRQTPGPSYERVNRIRISALIAVVGASAGASLAHLLFAARYGLLGTVGGALIGALLLLWLAYRLRR